MDWLDPSLSYQALLVVQGVHLLHHRLAKRHISFAEVVSGILLCVPPSYALAFVSPSVLTATYTAIAALQVIGSIWIKKLSPVW